MTEYKDLVKGNESPFIKCVTCSKIISNLTPQYRLLRKTLEEITNDGLDNVNELNEKYYNMYQESLSVETNVKLRIMKDIKRSEEEKLKLYERLKNIATMYKFSNTRKRRRENMYSKALMSLRDDEDINIDDVSERDIVLRATDIFANPEMSKTPTYLSKTLEERLKIVNFPFEDQDPDWRNALTRLKVEIPNAENVLQEINNFPVLITLPKHSFTEEQFLMLNLKDQSFQRHGAISYDILGITNVCCRTHIGEPVVKPLEVLLSNKDIINAERRNDKVLVLSRFTLPEDRPTPEAVRDFMKGVISSGEAFQRNYKNLIREKSKTINIERVLTNEQGNIEVEAVDEQPEQVKPNIIRKPVIVKKKIVRKQRIQPKNRLKPIEFTPPKNSGKSLKQMLEKRKTHTLKPRLITKIDIDERVQPGGVSVPLSQRPKAIDTVIAV